MTQRPSKQDAAPHVQAAQSPSPGLHEAWGDLQAGRLAEAESRFRRLLQQEPVQPIAAHFLGVVLHQLGRSDEGLAWVQSSLTEMPEWSEGHNTLGNLLMWKTPATGRADT